MSGTDLRGIADSGGCEQDACGRWPRHVRTHKRLSRGGAAKVLGLAALSLLGTLSPVEAQSVPTGPAILINRFSGECVNIPNGSSDVGTQMIQLTCQDPRPEQWALEQVSAGYYRIVSQFNGLCLEVAGASTSNGAAIQQSICSGSSNQSWQVRASSSWLQLVAKHSGKCMSTSTRDEGTPIIQQACNNDRQRWTISTAPLPSQWSSKVNFTIVPVAAANLADGRLVLWSAYGRLYFGGDHGQTYTTIYDPATGQSTEQLVANTGHDMFCPGTTMLPDGRILVNGGSSSSKTSIFSPTSGTWSTSNQMSIPRGYNGDTLLANGRVLTLGGSWSGGLGNKHAEVWTSGAGWQALPGVPIDAFIGPDPQGVYRGDNHLWLFPFAGWVFHAGPAAEMHWIDTSGNGNIMDAGPRADDAYSINGNAVLYDRGKILKLGGAPAYVKAPATDSAYVIDIRNGPTAPVTVRKVAPMAFPRAFNNSVVLPNGQVVVVGGMNYARVFSDDGAVYMAELWDPLTETFTRLASMTTPRTYHSVALLLLDGRVFVGGGGLCQDDYPSPCNNHTDAEILTPPYLLNADGSPAVRPVIIQAPATAAPATTITVKTDTPVTQFVLLRMTAVTHSVNNDQRRVPLTIAGGDPSAGYLLPLPTSKSVVLPGNYMLFALNAGGRPSIAKVIQIR